MGRSRYPGTQPFTENDKEIFFGRDTDIKNVFNLIVTNTITVLFGTSGVGKSSLIEAGVKNELAEKDYHVVSYRMGYRNEESKNLLGNFKGALQKEIPADTDFLKDISSGDDISVWQYIKTLQWKIDKVDQSRKKGIILILDQFEEADSYFESEIELFSREFAGLISNRIPQSIQDKMSVVLNRVEGGSELPKQSVGDNASNNRDALIMEQLDYLEKELPLHVLIAIREDRLHILDIIGKFVPNIFNNRYPLQPLHPRSIPEVILRPAELENEPGKEPFEANPFTYSNEFINTVLSKLTYRRKRTGEEVIEGFHLQLICSKAEAEIIHKNKEPGYKIEDEKFIGNLDSVAEDFYEKDILGYKEERSMLRLWNSTPHDWAKEQDILLKRFFIERKLIDERSETRICLDKGLFDKIGLSESILKELMAKRIVRKEPNSASGESYEISHDSLIRPVLRSASGLGELGEALFKNLATAGGPATIKQLKSLLKQEIIFEDRESFFLCDSIEPDISQQAFIDLLKQKGIIKESAGRKKTWFVCEAYNSAIRKLKAELEKASSKWKKLAPVIGGVALAVTMIAFGVMRTIAKSRNSAYAAIAMLNVDSISDKKMALKILSRCDTIIRSGGETDNFIQGTLKSTYDKIGRIFNSSDLSGKIISNDTMTIEQYKVSKDGSFIIVTFRSRKADVFDQDTRMKSVLYSKAGDSLKAWDSRVYVIDNRNLLAVIDSNHLLQFFQPVVKNGKLQVQTYQQLKPFSMNSFESWFPGIRKMNMDRMNISIKVSRSDRVMIFLQTFYPEVKRMLMYGDLNANRFSQILVPRSSESLIADFLDNDNIITVSALPKPQMAPAVFPQMAGPQNAVSANQVEFVVKVFDTREKRRKLMTTGTNVFVSPGMKTFVVVSNRNTTEVFDQEANLRRSLPAAPEEGTGVVFDPAGNLAFKGVGRIYYYQLNQDLLKSHPATDGMFVDDVFDSLVLIRQMSAYDDYRNPKTYPLLLLNLFTGDSSSIDRSKVKKASFSSDGKSLLLFNDISGWEQGYDVAGGGGKEKVSGYNDGPKSSYEVISIKNGTPQLLLLFYDELRFTPVVFDSLRRDNAISFMNSTNGYTGLLYFDSRLKLYNAQLPVVQFANDQKLILEWIRKKLPVSKTEKKQINEFLKWKNPWMPF